VGKYGVNIDEINDIGVLSLKNALEKHQITLIDDRVLDLM